jgi:hypothetical protein
MQQKRAATFAPYTRHDSLFHLLWDEARKCLGIAASGSGAKRAHGAGEAERILSEADCGAQLHHRLVVITGRRLREECVGKRGESFRRRGGIAELGRVCREPREDSYDVAINTCDRSAKRNARDRRGRVRPDSRKLLPFCRTARRRGAHYDFPGEPVQIARSRIIAEPFP